MQQLLHSPPTHPVAARILEPRLTAKEETYFMHQEPRPRGKPTAKKAAPQHKVATDGEMEFAMHQILFNLNVQAPNYYTMAYEGDRRWTFLGSKIEYIEVYLSRCRTRITIRMIGPIPSAVLCETDANKTILEVVRAGFLLLMRVITKAKVENTVPN
jgi:hypothetical protein